MDAVLEIVGNKIANLKLLAEAATKRKLTHDEYESMKNQVDLCKPLIKERFRQALIKFHEENGESRMRENL